MNNETKTPNTRITYLDGHADEVCVTMCSAAKRKPTRRRRAGAARWTRW